MTDRQEEEKKKEIQFSRIIGFSYFHKFSNCIYYLEI